MDHLDPSIAVPAHLVTDNDSAVTDSGSSGANDARSDRARFDRMMAPYLNHRVLGEMGCEEEFALVRAAQAENKQWQARTCKLGRLEDDMHQHKEWQDVRHTWRRTKKYRKVSGALDRILGMNYKLILGYAHKYRHWGQRFGYSVEDLFAVATFGFIRAVNKFNDKKGVRLSTYGVLWMRAEIGRELHGKARLIHVPYNVDVAAAAAATSLEKFRLLNGRKPDDEELAEQIYADWQEKLKRENAFRANHAKRKSSTGKKNGRRKAISRTEADDRVRHFHSTPALPSQLDAPIGEGEETFVSILVDAEAGRDIGPEALVRKETRRMVNEAVAALSPLERLVIEHRFLKEPLNEDENTLQNVAAIIPKELFKYGETVSRERIRQLQNLALGRLRKSLGSYANII